MSPAWRQSGLMLAIGLLAFGVAFTQEAVAAVNVWLASTAYNHCFLILPIALFLVWERRDGFAHLVPSASPGAAVLAIPLALLWLLADRLGIMEGRQLAVMALLQCLFLGALGESVYWYFRAPCWYLFFLVPFGGFLVAPLQHFTAEFAAHGLTLLGITHYLHGTTIEIRAGAFRIAQACAGLRFLIAAIAFAVLYALVIFRSTGRRLCFIAVCVIVPVIANGFRAIGIIALGYAEGSAKAAATDHVLYGYIFFSMVLMAIILLGLPFREDHAPPSLPRGRNASRSDKARLFATILVLLASLAAPITGLAMDRIVQHFPIMPPTLLSECQLRPSPPRKLPADAIRRDFSCNKGAHIALVAFPPGTTPEPIFDLRRQLGLIDLREAHLALIRASGPNTHQWQLAVSKSGRRMAASALLINGRQTLGSLITRWHMLPGLFNTDYAQLVVVVTLSTHRPATRAALQAALSNPDLTGSALRAFAHGSVR